ncbi:hypothetical protein NW069_01085 [Mycoplasmopsis cynos]|uniref:hypothetical protein n=1 Tax=Mycoplasmopsis cynos TaxID=171284 RepID=UPI002201D6D0|nr:hypothetical protein [Mycoplasmopsis cynos]UWV80773.1 hypothetical protein NW069_01085 [Mycoplasmopsis cynos]
MGVISKLYFSHIQKQIAYVNDAFIKLNIINHLDKEYILCRKINEFESLDEFIEDFCEQFRSVSLTPTYFKMIKNFYFFYFYHQVFKHKKYWVNKESLKFLKNKTNNIIFSQLKKRDFYYDFLDEFKKIKDHNRYLILILRKVL